MPGFPKVLQSVWEAYRVRREQVDTQAGELTRAITEAASGQARSAGGAVSPELLALAAQKLAARFDEVHGGFGSRPKFPNTTALAVLLRAGDRARARKALDGMRSGGIWDHLGGGFHRYSTDERWLVPHFEKMLYDNAQLLRVYVDAWRVSGEPLYERTARSIAAYVAREMTSPDGGVYATQDADSEGEEGRFFVWTPSDVDAACGSDDEAARVAKAVFDVTPQGNFEGTGATVLSTPRPVEETASALSMTREIVEAALDRARARMFEAREKRPKPFRDEKILASWNGLMAGGLADAGAALDDPALIGAAERALALVERVLVVQESDARARVLRHYKDGVARGPGFLDDHAFVGDAALDLYEATGAPRWVTLARSLGESILAHFHDKQRGGFFFTPDDGETILVRAKDPYDHAVPSGASIACKLLLRLGTLVASKFTDVATRAIEEAASAAADNPLAMSITLGLADRLARGSVDIVLVGPRTSAATRALAREAHRAYLPDRVLAWLDPVDPQALEACRALGEGKAAQPEPSAYVCRGRTCSLPMRQAKELARALV